MNKHMTVCHRRIYTYITHITLTSKRCSVGLFGALRADDWSPHIFRCSHLNTSHENKTIHSLNLLCKIVFIYKNCINSYRWEPLNYKWSDNYALLSGQKLTNNFYVWKDNGLPALTLFVEFTNIFCCFWLSIQSFTT